MQALTHRWRPFTSAVALGLVLGVLLTPIGMAHLDLAPDVCERPLPAPSTDGDVRVVPVTEFGLHDHCFTCHWLQSFRSTLLASGVVPVDANETCLLPTTAAVRIESFSRHSVPARAPPSFC